MGQKAMKWKWIEGINNGTKGQEIEANGSYK